jgi:hypothetical protein
VTSDAIFVAARLAAAIGVAALLMAFIAMLAGAPVP